MSKIPPIDNSKVMVIHKQTEVHKRIKAKNRTTGAAHHQKQSILHYNRVTIGTKCTCRSCV